MVGDYGTVMRSNDGGQTFDSIEVPREAHLRSLSFLNNSHGFVAGDKGVVMRTRNDGWTWEVLVTGTHVRLNDIYMENSRCALVLGAMIHREHPDIPSTLGVWSMSLMLKNSLVYTCLYHRKQSGL